jgi:hypothetical protein
VIFVRGGRGGKEKRDGILREGGRGLVKECGHDNGFTTPDRVPPSRFL